MKWKARNIVPVHFSLRSLRSFAADPIALFRITARGLSSSEMETHSHHSRVAARQVAFQPVTFVTEKHSPGPAAHANFAQPIRCFVADRTQAARIDHATLDRRGVPIQTELRGRIAALARMMKIVAEGDPPVEMIQPLGLGLVNRRVAVGGIPTEGLQPNPRA